MKNTLHIDHKDRLIVMDRTFAMNALNTRSDEYEHLQKVRKHYPKYSVVQRHIRKNENKKTYKGLTYAYMERYIEGHANAEAIMAEYKELRLISECHCKARRYPKIKKWFLKKYPEVENFGIDESMDECTTETGAKYEAVMAPLVKHDVTDSSFSLVV